MRIGIDARMYRSEVAGISRYSQNLIGNLFKLDHQNEYVLFMTSEDKKEFENFIIENSFKIKNLKLKIVLCNIPHYSIEEQTKFAKIIEKENLDLMHFLNFNHPINYKGKFIVTIHDLTLLLFPDTARKTNIFKRKAFQYVMKKAITNAQKVIAVSNNTKSDIISKFKIANTKIDVIYEAVDDKIFNKTSEKNIINLKKKYAITNEKIILHVGQFRPHKNLPGLIEAFDIVKKDTDCKLIIIGKPDLKHKRFYDVLQSSNNKKDIILPGFVSNEELSCFYQMADVFVFPSLYEGFGLSGLEAMQMGVPVIASNTSSLPEIYKKAAVYFDPLKTDEIADKIEVVLSDNKLRIALIKEGKKLLTQYSWEKTAQETIKTYNSFKSEIRISKFETIK